MGSVASRPTPPQINFYRPARRGVALNPGTRVLLFTAIAVFLGVMTLAGLGELYLAGVRADREAAAERLRQSQQQLAEVQTRRATPPVDPFLEAEYERLDKTAGQLRQTLDAVRQQRADADGGFAEVFAGLARNPVDGLWLNRIGLTSGGTHLSLGGRTYEPALVPKWLQTLATEQAFAGRSFRKARFERRGEAGGALIEFELRSGAAEEGGDAG
jgi:hypothetical protein